METTRFNGNIGQLCASIEREISENDSAIGRHRREIESYLSDAQSRGASTLDYETDLRSERLFTDIEQLQNKNRRLEAQLARAREVESEETRNESRLNSVRPTNAGSANRNRPAYDEVMRVGSEPMTYRQQIQRNPDGSPAEPTFLSDLYRAQILNDPSAHERLARHGHEMTREQPKLIQRAVSSGGVPGFAPPAYLTQYFAEYARAGRPVANLCTRLPLPAEGMSVNIPRVTTPTATGVQATENATIANQDPATTLLSVPVVTVGGYVVVSRQALERGPMTEEVIVADLAADYNAKLDGQLVNGSGSSGQHLGILNVSGINAVTYTDASPTLGAMWPKIASAVGQVMSGRFAGPSAMTMTPVEWAWMLSTKDGNGRPLIQPNQGAYNPLGNAADQPTYQGTAGQLFNVPVHLDGNIPANLGTGTNETRIIVADFADIMLFEDASGAPSQLRFEQPSGQSLGVLLVAYGYSAFAAGRQPKAISVLAGSGLITPAL
jgi:HK97 family phage major capsid protein